MSVVDPCHLTKGKALRPPKVEDSSHAIRWLTVAAANKTCSSYQRFKVEPHPNTEATQVQRGGLPKRELDHLLVNDTVGARCFAVL